MQTTRKHTFVIVGGGTGGIAVAARLARSLPSPDVCIVEPSEKHYYQPLWTLVGGGAATREETVRDEATLIPKGATWLRDFVDEFYPEENAIKTRGGETIAYDYLIVAPASRSTGTRSRASATPSATAASAPTTPTSSSTRPGPRSRPRRTATRSSPTPTPR